MKDPNPIIPPGASLENSRRGRSKMRLAVVGIVLVHVMVFLFQSKTTYASQVQKPLAPQKC